jgi:catalase
MASRKPPAPKSTRKLPTAKVPRKNTASGSAPVDPVAHRASGTARGASRPDTTALQSVARSTVSGPATLPASGDSGSRDAAVAKFAAQGDLAAQISHNANKPHEYGDESVRPRVGDRVEHASPAASASTVTEANASAKLGKRIPVGVNENVQPLDGHRADSSGRGLTTNQGVPVADNQHSLKVGLRGPSLLEDFILREKITHFDHERIPERVVHARGSGAHGEFECYRALTDLTRASVFAEDGKRTPVFVRFSTVAGERGSTDTARDVRGFATKFYTDEGIWDLVGNNIPVFFIQDAIKFPDLVHWTQFPRDPDQCSAGGDPQQPARRTPPPDD